MKNNIHWCKGCEEAGHPTQACLEIPRVSFDDQDTNTDKIYIIKEHLNGVINTINNMRYGSADQKQFKATLEHNIDTVIRNERHRILEIIRESGHQQEDDTIWCNMDEIIEKINENY